MSLARQEFEPVPTEFWTSAYRKKTYYEKKLIYWTEEMAKVMLSEGALRKEYESLEWENLALTKDVEDQTSESQRCQEICRIRDKFMKMEVDVQEKNSEASCQFEDVCWKIIKVPNKSILETIIKIQGRELC